MEVHDADPEFTNSAHVRANYRRAVRIALGFVAALFSTETRTRPEHRPAAEGPPGPPT